MGSQPLVGVYLDEQPVTTIGNSLDVHIYDINRVEALSGPQGTLFGASSMAGTLRIITNKPDPPAFTAGYDLELNQIEHGGAGKVVEGFVNMPLNERAAIRLVGFVEKDAGYIANVAEPRAYLSDLGRRTQQCRAGRERFQQRGYQRRARGAQSRSERSVDGHSGDHLSEAEGARHVCVQPGSGRPRHRALSSRSAISIAGIRPH